jgi:8-oxo-dGTP pyrophosphatase MutT (NUDIX family)
MTHIKAYTKEDGTVVPAHEDTRPAAKPSGKIIKILESAMPEKFKHFIVGHLQESAIKPKAGKPKWEPVAKPGPVSNPASKWAPSPSKGSLVKPKSIWPGAVIHPELDEHGQPVSINQPDKASAPATWMDPQAWACWIPGSPTPAKLNGVPMAPWTDHPTDPDDWEDVEGQDHMIDEPELPPSPKAQAAGVVIEEPDGRVWVVHPTNRFGGYKRTFPKGHLDEGVDLQASAIKEAFEESGLKVEITGYLCDVVRTTTVARYYRARRVGGSPAAPGWESQAVSLVPKAQLYTALNMPTDHGVAEMIGAGPKPKIPEPKAAAPYTPEPWF